MKKISIILAFLICFVLNISTKCLGNSDFFGVELDKNIEFYNYTVNARGFKLPKIKSPKITSPKSQQVKNVPKIANNKKVVDSSKTKTEKVDSKKSRSTRPEPDPKAEGNPHTIIEKPGQEGQYTTHNEDGTFKQYRGSGKPHGDIPRPNVKENKNNPSPTGPKPGNPTVREAKPNEIPKGK